MKRALSLSVMVAGALSICGCASTVTHATCDDPSVTNVSLPDVYIVALPFQTAPKIGDAQAGSDGPIDVGMPLVEAAQVLNQASAIEAVRIGSTSRSTHVTLLASTAGSGSCRVGDVYRTFTDAQAGIKGRLLLGSAIFFWGDIYGDQQDVVIASHMRVLWKDNVQTFHIEAPLHVDGSSPSTFTVEMPDSTISFPLRTLSDGVLRSSKAHMTLDFKDSTSEGAATVAAPLRFRVERANREWIEVRDLDQAREVWLSTAPASHDTDTLVPEFSYLHAMAAFVRYRIFHDDDSAREVAGSLSDYRKALGLNETPHANADALGFADSLEGALNIEQFSNTGNLSNARRAEELLARARQRLPRDAGLENMLAVAKMVRCCSTQKDAEDITTLLEQARELDPGNVAIAHNLLNWYRLAETPMPAFDAFAKSDIRLKRQRLEAQTLH